MKPIIIANWKMNPQTAEEAEKLFDSIKKGVKKIKNAEVIICPPFVYLPLLKGLAIGAQNIFFEEKGAYTGEISPKMLNDLKIDYVIIGHSERRKYFNETNESVNKKMKAALNFGLAPILCAGETEEERKGGKTEEVVEKQLKEGLSGISIFKRLIIAYEPVWAIGTGNPCNVEKAKKVGLFIRKILADIYSLEVSRQTPILYGGSVNSNNSASYVGEAGMNGFLVGGASLNAKEFIKIVEESA